MLRFPTLTIFALAAAFVTAQSPSASDTSASIACAVSCNTAAAASVRCASAEDLPCVCPSLDPFINSIHSCITAGCPDEAQKVEAYYIIYCAAITPVSSSAGTPAPGTSRPSTSIPASGTATTTRSSTPGAAFKNTPVAGAMGALTALVGAAIF